jgi:hypothetical protein
MYRQSSAPPYVTDMVVGSVYRATSHPRVHFYLASNSHLPTLTWSCTLHFAFSHHNSPKEGRTRISSSPRVWSSASNRVHSVVWISNVPPKACVAGLVASLWHHWEVAELLRRWGLVEGSEVTEVTLEGFIGTLASSSLSAMRWAVCPATYFHHDVLPCHRPRTQDQVTMDRSLRYFVITMDSSLAYSMWPWSPPENAGVWRWKTTPHHPIKGPLRAYFLTWSQKSEHTMITTITSQFS